MIKPEFWTDEKIIELPLPARLLFIGLLNFSDDEGKFKYSPKAIKGQIFPTDSKPTTKDIKEYILLMVQIKIVELGLDSLKANTTGCYNTGSGYYAGCNNTDGCCNVFEGYAAGRYLANGSTNLTSPDNSIYLGACTRGCVVGDSNVTVIGYCACACGDNTISLGNENVTDTYINGCTSVVGDISASGNGYFTCVIAGGYFEEKAAHPSLAEHPTGSLVVIGEDGNLTLSTSKNDKKIFGVTQKGACQPIILGAEPVLVTGNIKAGDFITTSDKLGHGMKTPNPIWGSIIAQSMEDGTGDSHLVQAMIRKL